MNLCKIIEYLLQMLKNEIDPPMSTKDVVMSINALTALIEKKINVSNEITVLSLCSFALFSH